MNKLTLVRNLTIAKSVRKTKKKDVIRIMKLVRLGIGIVVLVLSIGYWGFLKYWYCSNDFLGIGIGIEVEIYGIVCVWFTKWSHVKIRKDFFVRKV